MLNREDILYPDLSYKIIGCAFELFNEIGGGHKEKIYQAGMYQALTGKSLQVKEQVPYKVIFQEKVVGNNYFDFLVDDKIIVELKSLSKFSKANYDQVLNYLKVSNLKLALLIMFTQNEVRHKRVINFEALNSNKQDS